MDLARDLLDKKVVDRNGREMGRVDGIVIEMREGAAPRVAAIEIGPSVLAYRVHPVLARWVAGLELALGIAEGRPLRIPFSAILNISEQVTVDRALGETSASTVERALRSVVGAILGSS